MRKILKFLGTVYPYKSLGFFSFWRNSGPVLGWKLTFSEHCSYKKKKDSVREVCYQVVTNTNCTNLLFRDICGIDPFDTTKSKSMKTDLKQTILTHRVKRNVFPIVNTISLGELAFTIFVGTPAIYQRLQKQFSRHLLFTKVLPINRLIASKGDSYHSLRDFLLAK